MKANIAVAGRFHYHNYVRYLDDRGLLGTLYYAHRLGEGAHAFAVSKEKLENLWIKEYLVHAHLRLLKRFAFTRAAEWYTDAWEMLALWRWRPCDVLHFMLHGGGIRLLGRAQRDGAKIVGEPVNSHPDVQTAILNREYERLGLRRQIRNGRAQREIVQGALMADALVVASQFIKRSYVEHGFAPERINVIPYGVNLARFSPKIGRSRKHGTEPFRVVCVAAISVRKAQIDLLEAWKQLKLRNAQLVLIGRVDPEMRPVVAHYESTFRHISHVPNAMLADYYRSSSVFVLPSVEDGFGVVCTEAMACGLPIIATENTGAADVVEHGTHGYVVPIRSPEAIAAHIEELYKDEALRQSMAEAAAAKAAVALTWDAYAERLITVYRDTLAADRSVAQSAEEGMSVSTASHHR